MALETFEQIPPYIKVLFFPAEKGYTFHFCEKEIFFSEEDAYDVFYSAAEWAYTEITTREIIDMINYFNGNLGIPMDFNKFFRDWEIKLRVKGEHDEIKEWFTVRRVK